MDINLLLVQLVRDQIIGGLQILARCAAAVLVRLGRRQQHQKSSRNEQAHLQR